MVERGAFARAGRGRDALVHRVGITHESGAQHVERMDREATENAGAAGKAAGIRRYLHMGAMGGGADAPVGEEGVPAGRAAMAGRSGTD